MVVRVRMLERFGEEEVLRRLGEGSELEVGLTGDQLARKLGVSESTVKRWRLGGVIPGRRFRNGWRYDWYSVVASLRRNMEV